ncbi:MAG: O-antigen ligase family protein [Clostridiaceae bacterium]|nr:O-antigen ligase family protein [Clostridiaceae bacterium]
MNKIINFDNIILFSIFMSPFSTILIYKTNIADFKLIEVLWLAIFVTLMIKKAANKELLIVKNSAYTNKISNSIFMLYISVAIFSCLFSININRSIKELFQYIYLFILMYTIYYKSKDINFFNKIVKTMILANFFLVTICILSYISGKVIVPSFILSSNGAIYVNNNLFSTNILVESGNEILRLNGVLGLGATAIANQILIQSLFVNYFIRTITGKKKIFFYLLLIANLITMVITYSRVGILIFIAVHLLSVMSKNQIKNFVIIVAITLLCALILNLFTNVQERLLETFNTEEQSSKYHFAIWIIAFKTGFNNILTGIGLGNMAFSYDSYGYEFYRFGIAKTNAVNVHNFILQIWSEQGMIGLLSNVLLLFSPIFYYFKIKYVDKIITSGKSIYYFIILAYTATLMYNLTNNNFYIETFWITLGLVYSIRSQVRDIHISNSDIKYLEDNKLQKVTISI